MVYDRKPIDPIYRANEQATAKPKTLTYYKHEINDNNSNQYTTTKQFNVNKKV